MRTGAILANSGHFDIEIDVKGIREKSSNTEQVRPFMEKFEIEGVDHIYILGEGRLINLAAAEGHPSDVMSMSFCGQALACEYLVKNSDKLKAEVIQLPEEIDDEIAKLQLKTMDVEIDKLTPEQIEYLNSWQEGTS
jgi:adenosylhomocysteinase